MSLARLTELAKLTTETPLYVKGIYDVWEWSKLKLHVSQVLWNRLLKVFPPKEGIDPYYNIEYGIPLTLIGIRIVIDHGLDSEPLVWVLVDTAGEELERGIVEPEQIMHSGEIR